MLERNIQPVKNGTTNSNIKVPSGCYYSAYKDLQGVSFQGGYIPKYWMEVRMAFIPTSAKPSNTAAKGFTRISLASLLLKRLKRLVDLHKQENSEVLSLVTSSASDTTNV